MNLYSGCMVLCAAYLLGSIPTGFIIARLAGVTDIRAHGSGNIGATNVARVLGAKFFPLIFVVDAAKAYLPLAWCATVGMSIPLQCMAAGTVFIGNVCSIFLRGSGGKGVATGVGILAALAPVALLPLVAVFLAVLAVTRTVGVSSVIAVATLPGGLWYLQAPIPVQILGFCIASGIMIRHVDNIKRYFVPVAS